MKFPLHPYQNEAIAKIRASLMAGCSRPAVQIPTGGGKTVVAAAIIESALAKNKLVVVVVPFLSLIDQWIAALAEQGIYAVGVMQGAHPATDPSQPVQLASLQTLRRRRLPKADLVIVDEAHRMFDFLGDWMAMPDWQRVPFIGLTATPWTKGLGKHFNDLIVVRTTGELIRDGFLAPFRTFAPTHPDLSKVHTVAGDYHEGELSEVMSQTVLVADVVTTWLRIGEDRPTLCFAVDCAHARKLAAQFEAAGVPAGYVDANTPREERNAMGRRLAEGQIKVICNVGTMTTGVDLDIRCIILARPTKSEILFVQIVGRGLRTAKDKGKTDCLILDHSDTTLNLGFVTDIHHDRLDDGRHRASTSARPERPPALPKECPSCKYVKPAGIHKCPNCQFAPSRQSQIEERSGELVALSGKRNKKGDVTPHSKQQTWSMLLWYQREKGKSSNFAKAKFMARYGHWPNGLHYDPQPPDAAFLSWLRSTQIAWAKRQDKLRRTGGEAQHVLV